MPADQERTRDQRTADETGPSHLILESSAQLRAAIENSRHEVAQLVVRIAGVEDRIDRGAGAARSLWWLAGVALLLGFCTISLTWQVSRRAAEIRNAVRSASTLVERSAQATDLAFTRIDGALAGHAAAAEKIAAAIAGIEATARQMQAALVELDHDADSTASATVLIGRQLTDTTHQLSALRRELDDRLTRHHEAFVAGRGEMIAAVTSSIGRVEADLRSQAEELKAQREQVGASAARMRQTQQRMLGEATHAVAVQLEGLRQILAGLEGELTGGEVTESEAAAEAAPVAEVTEADPTVSFDAESAVLEIGADALDAEEQGDVEPVAEVGENGGGLRK